MNYDEALQKLERLRDLLEAEGSKENRDQAYQLYGEIEDLATRLLGVQQVHVDIYGGSEATYPNFIEAGYFSGRTIHKHAGQAQLQKLIGKVRKLAQDPGIPTVPTGISETVQVLRRLRECCQYLKEPPISERDVQDILWIMLRSHFDRVDREDTLPKFGLKSYRPDFGIPDLRLLIEVKFVGPKTDVRQLQEEILADVPGYLSGNPHFDGILVILYDDGHKLRDPGKFIADLRNVEGIVDVIVIPGIRAG